ncbi:hypothetical protein [Streptomyces silvisoli]|uniref:Uncharacterized protein n=1 Tax=Streptomyces silvisoli TaxID=3034235 RepID=A0ABT5ZF57_9ACTN|nr:hypothetical protein [Streptomyces silvisoli]MDF3288463.1 hypothetical protein [Streptomyces silvisoli]
MAGVTQETPGGCAMLRRLLLFAALLFGIFTMHTIGHPAMPAMPGMSAAAESGPTAASAPAAETDPTAETDLAAPVAAHGRPAPPSTAAPAAQAPSPGHVRHPQPAHSMDPLSVCLAVLGAWGSGLLAALGLALELAETGAGVALAALRTRLAGARPVPPPRISLSLARLSVSRI